MKTASCKTLTDASNTDAVTAFIAEELSWKKLYYDKFSHKQKIVRVACLLFLFIVFLGTIVASIYFIPNKLLVGAVDIIFLAILSTFVWRKITVYETEVFEREYNKSMSYVFILQIKIYKLNDFLGEHNTSENRAVWLKYYNKKVKGLFYTNFIPYFLIIAIMQIYNLLHLDKPSPNIYFFGMLYLFFLYMIVFALLSATRFRFCFRIRIYNEAVKLISEIDRQRLNGIQ